MRANLNAQYFLLQKGGEYRAGNAFVFHEVLEHGVVDGVGNR
jgi:hypothetical protein